MTLALRALLFLPTFVACDDVSPLSRPPPRAPARSPVALRPPNPTSAREAPSEARADATLPATLARCIADTQRNTPPALASAVAALDPTRFYEDACRLEVAPRSLDPTLCSPIASSVLRDACMTRVAVATATPERCPDAAGTRGRDAICVALASRNPSLCAAASGGDRGRCLALAHARLAACDTLDTLFRDACRRDFASLSPWLRAAPGTLAAPSHVVVTRLDTASDAMPLASWALREYRRGAWLDTEGALWVVDPALGSAHTVTLVGEEPVVALRIPLAQPAAAGVRASVRVVLPGLLPLDTSDGAVAWATWMRTPARRGDVYAVQVHMNGAVTGLGVALRIDVEGFVRDVVSAAVLR